MNTFLNRIARSYHRLVQWYVGISWSRPWTVLSVFALFTVFMGVMSSRIGISTDLRVLLPSSTPSVMALEASEARLGATDFFTLAFEDSSIERVGQFQKAVAESLGKWEKAKWVQYDEDRRFFESHALLYLPEDQLIDLEARLHSIEKKASGDWDPLVVDLLSEEGPAAPASLEGWPDKMALYKQGMPMDVVDALLERIQKETGDQGNAVTLDKPATSDAAAPPSDPTLPDSLRDRMIGWHQAKGKWVGVIIAQLGEPSTDARFAQEAKDRGEAAAAAAKKALGFDIHTAVVGAYSDPSSEIAEINADMWVASTVAITLILSLLLYYLRRPGNVLVVFLPLLAAMVWMMGSAELVYGRLTVLTSFVLALLSGLGIEYTIHVYSRWMEERRKGDSAQKAMETTLVKTGRSLFSAMLASVTCMLALQVGHFQGFKEFGVVVSMGIMEAFLASITLLPPVLFLMLRFGKALERKQHLRWLAALVPSEKNAEGAVLVPRLSWSRGVMVATFGVTMALTVLFLFAPSVQFENDFANLRSGGGNFKWLSSRIEKLFEDEEAIAKANQSRISYGRAVGKGKNTSPSVLMAETEEQMREVHDTLGARFGSPADTMLKSFVTIQSFVPRPEVQLQRLERVRRIREVLDGPGFAKLDSSARARVQSLRQYTECDTFGFASLPPYAQRFMTEKDGTHGRFGLIYADMRESDAIESKKFQDRFSRFPTKTGDVTVSSTGFIYADVVDMVKDDVGRLAVFVFLFLAIVVWLDTRSWRGLLVNMGYIGLISLWTYGAMGWLGLKLGLFNIVVIPALLSNTVDATIHLFHRRMETGAGRMGEVMHTAGSSVLAGTLTNAFAFLSLIVVSHRGLNTIGMLACLGYVAGITIMFATMPYLMEVVCPKEPQAGHSDEG